MIMLKHDYFIDADDRNFILCKKAVSEKGNVRYDPVSYHMDLDQSLTVYQCSECKEEWCFEVGEDIHDLNYNYCPNCGANMDEE